MGKTNVQKIKVHTSGLTRRHLLGLAATASALGLAGGLAGCASSRPSAFYGLSAGDTSGASLGQGRKRNVQILVPMPNAFKALDTLDIAVVQGALAYSYLPGVAWADNLPKVVQAGIVETLQNTGRLKGVGLPGQSLLIDYQLQTDIRAFQIEVSGSARAVVEISARLVNDHNGRVVDTRVFKATAPAPGGVAPNAAVKALNMANEQVLGQMAQWVLTSL